MAGPISNVVGFDDTPFPELVARSQLGDRIPEPLRLGHLIAGGVTTGTRRGRT